MWGVLGGLAVAAASLAHLYWFARPAKAIWRGDASRVPRGHLRIVAVNARTYPSALLCVGTTAIAVAFGGIGAALAAMSGRPIDDGGPASSVLLGIALALLLSNLVLMPLTWLVHATNRPTRLVPPAYRGPDRERSDRPAEP